MKINKKIVLTIIALILTSIVAMAATGVVKLSKSPGFSATFGNFVEGGADKVINSGEGSGQIINVSFYLPVDSYVYVSSSGGIEFLCGTGACAGTGRIWISMDGTGRADWDYNKFSSNDEPGWAGFSTSTMYKLKKGYHTAYVNGESDKKFWGNANIVVIATQKGTFSGSSWYISSP